MGSKGETDFEMEFTPSLWSKRFGNRDEVLKNHVRHAEEVSGEVLLGIPNLIDVAYGEGPEEKYDVFGTDLPNEAPVLVFVHGGFWQELSRPQSRYPAKSLHKAGFRTIIIGYDLCPSVTLYQIIEEIKAATRSILEYAKRINSRGVYFAGHSAGAHLIAGMLSDATFWKTLPREYFLGVVLISGVFDLTHLTKTTVNKAVGLKDSEARQLSPICGEYFHLKESKINFHIVVGENDSLTFRNQSRDFYDKLMESCNVENVNFEILDGVDHFDIMEIVTEDENYLVEILRADLNKKNVQ